MEEQRLISGCKKAEVWAYKEIYERYAPVMLALCMRYVNDRETARDLMHDGFIRVFKKVGQYSAKGSFEGWMKRVFVTTTLEYLRSKQNGKFTVPLDECEESAGEVNPDVIERLSAAELMECIGKLPKGYRTVFNLFAIEGYSHKEIAGMLQIQESTSKTQFLRARNQLQKIITQILQQENAGKK